MLKKGKCHVCLFVHVMEGENNSLCVQGQQYSCYSYALCLTIKNVYLCVRGFFQICCKCGHTKLIEKMVIKCSKWVGEQDSIVRGIGFLHLIKYESIPE